MNLTAAERTAYAERVGSTVGYLMQLAYGNKQADLGFADALVAVSGGQLTLDALPLTKRARQQHDIRSGVQRPAPVEAAAP